MKVTLSYQYTSRQGDNNMWPILFVFAGSIHLILADGCKDTKPDFKAPGRRISEQKCYEYSWERKQLEKCSKGAANTEYPYMGFLGYRVPDTQEVKFLCGGFLISPKFLVTAAHCVRVPKSKGLWVPEVVRFGNKNLDDNEPHVDVKIRNTTYHPHYETLKENDIGLVELESEVQFSRSVHPGCLWQKATLDGVGNTFSPGWHTAGAVDKTNVISELSINVIKPEQCFERVNKIFRLLDSHICTKEYVASNPLLQSEPTGGSFLITRFNLDGKAGELMPFALGVASFRVPDELETEPSIEPVGIYSALYNALDWIEQAVWK